MQTEALKKRFRYQNFENRNTNNCVERYKKLYQLNFRGLNGKSIVRTREEEFHI